MTAQMLALLLFGELILVCADYCPPCQVQKKNMPAGSRIIDASTPEANALMGTDRRIPLTVHKKDGKVWKRVGVFNVEEWIKGH